MDSEFAALLQRYLNRELFGDETDPGLYRGLVNAGDWENFLSMRSRILTLEGVRTQMGEIIKEMNGEAARADGPRSERRVN